MHHDAHGGQFNDTSRTLECMKGTEHTINSLERRPLPLQRNKVIVRLTDQLARLGDELFLPDAVITLVFLEEDLALVVELLDRADRRRRELGG